jgi:hypothetical protein
MKVVNMLHLPYSNNSKLFIHNESGKYVAPALFK